MSDTNQHPPKRKRPKLILSNGAFVEQPSPEVCSRPAYDLICSVGMAPMGYCGKEAARNDTSAQWDSEWKIAAWRQRPSFFLPRLLPPTPHMQPRRSAIPLQVPCGVTFEQLL